MTKATPKPLTAQKVRAVIKKADLPISKIERSVRGWSGRLPGFYVTVDTYTTGAIHLLFSPSYHQKSYNERMMAQAVEVLAAAGIVGDPAGNYCINNLRWSAPAGAAP